MSDAQLDKLNGSPVKYSDPVAFAELVAGFEDWCKDTGRKLLIEWLYYYLDLSDEAAADMKARNDGCAEILKRAINLCRGWLVDNASGGTWRDAVCIFCLKNNYGYTDSSKIEVDSNITVQFRDDELAD